MIQVFGLVNKKTSVTFKLQIKIVGRNVDTGKFAVDKYGLIFVINRLNFM